jgi:hypothetical protein
MDRTELLNLIYASRTRLEAALARFEPSAMSRTTLPNGWTIKDLLAHLGWWEQYCAGLYQSQAAGEQPQTVNGEAQVTARNQDAYDQFRTRDLDEVRAYEVAAFRSLLEIVETAPQPDLFDPQRFDWLNGVSFAEVVGWNTYGHYAEHFPDLDSILAESKDNLRPSAGAPAVEADAPVSDIVRRAGEFLRREGRDIEQAMYEHHFGGMPLSQLADVLAHYQNDDGGFHGLEVDIKAPQSNPFADELALKIMWWADFPRDHPILQRTVAHLEQAQGEDGSWRFAAEIYQHDLAPWFKGWQWPNLNPACTLAGLLKQLGMGSDTLHTRVQDLFNRMANPKDLIGDQFYDARPYAYYFQTEWDFLKAEYYRWGVAWWLTRQHFNNPGLDATHFVDYIPSPSSAIARRLPTSIVHGQLERLLREQSADGGWPTPYDASWRGWNTIVNLLILRAHGWV